MLSLLNAVYHAQQRLFRHEARQCRAELGGDARKDEQLSGERLAHGDARDAAAVHRLDRKFADACGGIEFRVNGAGTQAADGDMAAGGAQFLVNRFAQANHIVLDA